MVVTIVARTEQVRRGHRRLAESLSEKLQRYIPGIVFAEWALDSEGHADEKVVHCNVHAEHSFYRITSTADTFSRAMHMAAEKLTEQRRRQKQKRIRGRHSTQLAA